jgi:DnaJ family protein C protein 19
MTFSGFFMVAGTGFVCIAMMGKGGVQFYRAVKGGTAFSQATSLGTYYHGGFEKAITRREAALILGCKETSDDATIQASHRKMMFNNHPDNGGSTYLATKINEAKEFLQKE